MGNVAEVHDVQRIVVSLKLANVCHLSLVGILPRLGDGTVVDHRGGAVETESSLLHILLDGVEWDLRRNFRLRARSMSLPAGQQRNPRGISIMKLTTAGFRWTRGDASVGMS